MNIFPWLQKKKRTQTERKTYSQEISRTDFMLFFFDREQSQSFARRINWSSVQIRHWGTWTFNSWTIWSFLLVLRLPFQFDIDGWFCTSVRIRKCSSLRRERGRFFFLFHLKRTRQVCYVSYRKLLCLIDGCLLLQEFELWSTVSVDAYAAFPLLRYHTLVWLYPSFSSRFVCG